ncbi:MAG: hypothetical protein M1816_002081 [Peltula sp. TS41687]|nr:MAG: hypothetical protein M1816_002081 [Peltula sp. TS41687]
MGKIREDPWLWLGIGVVTFISFRTVLYQMEQIRELTAVHDDDDEPQPPNTIDQKTEEVSGPAFDLLLEEIASPDLQARTTAISSLKYLCKSPAVFTRLATYPTFHAVITALENCLKDPSREEFVRRPPAERDAMYCLGKILHYDVGAALKAGLVKRWLAQYPFGDTEAEKHETIRKLRSWSTTDKVMADILGALDNHPEGRKQMRLAGLTGSSIGETDDDDDDFDLVSGYGGPDETEVVIVRRQQRTGDSPEERRIRRRRREAIVVSDGRQPLIIERFDSVPRGNGGYVERVRRVGGGALRNLGD